MLNLLQHPIDLPLVQTQESCRSHPTHLVGGTGHAINIEKKRREGGKEEGKCDAGGEGFKAGVLPETSEGEGLAAGDTKAHPVFRRRQPEPVG